MRRTRLYMVLLALAVMTRVAAGELDLSNFGFGPSGSALSGPGMAERPLVGAKLIAESATIAPGKPFKLVLEMNHASGAYTYWTNPGGPGLGSTVRWRLPEGFSVSEPEWPAPEKYENGPITSYVHKGRIAAVMTVTPPRDLPPGASVTLAGEVDTQACTPRSCNPIRLPIEATLAVGAAPGPINPAVARAEALLPTRPTGWRFEVVERDADWLIAMHPGASARVDPEGLYFFDDGEPRPLVDSQRPQVLRKEDGVLWLSVPRGPERPEEGERLDGILYAASGWLKDRPEITSFEVDLPIAAPGAAEPPASLQASGEKRGGGMLMVFAFLGGLLLNVMPCVFPVIGLKIMGFAKQAHKDRRAVFLHGLAYTAGVLLCFWTLSFIVITMGRGWGAQLQSDWFLFALCHVFVIMSMNMAGVFEIGAGAAGAGASLASREGLKRSFFTGLIATITSTPCSAPFLGTALAYALALPPLLALGMFTLMGLGFSFPYLALSLVPGWLKKLPKPGPWMDTFRQAMCFPLFATTAYLFWTMEAMLPEFQYLLLLFGLVLTAMACWLYGKSQHSQVTSPRRSRIVMAVAVAALAAGLWLGMPRAASKLEWREWSPEIVERLRREGRPVFVDFTARWCATCQLNKRVFQDPGLVSLFLDKNVALLKADWTRHDERITTTLKNEFNKAAVPVTVLYRPGEESGDLLPEILTVGNVAEEVAALPEPE